MKFVGFTLDNDRATLAGLPQPIHEGVAILKKHMYRSLAEVQVEVRIFSLILFLCFLPFFMFFCCRGKTKSPDTQCPSQREKLNKFRRRCFTKQW